MVHMNMEKSGWNHGNNIQSNPTMSQSLDNYISGSWGSKQQKYEAI